MMKFRVAPKAVHHTDEYGDGILADIHRLRLGEPREFELNKNNIMRITVTKWRDYLISNESPPNIDIRLYHRQRQGVFKGSNKKYFCFSIDKLEDLVTELTDILNEYKQLRQQTEITEATGIISTKKKKLLPKRFQ